MTVRKAVPAIPKGWTFSAKDKSVYDVRIEKSGRKKGKHCVRIKGTGSSDGFGSFGQECGASKYRGERIKMTAWVKSELVRGHGQLVVAH